MTLALGMGFWNEWELYGKVTFDQINQLIIANPGVTTLSVKEDIYSAWKRWVAVQLNSRATQAMRTTGGDPAGDQFTGDTYFLINEWRLQYDPSLVALNGILYSDDFDSPIINLTGDIVYQSVVSNLAVGVVQTENIVTGDVGAVAADVRLELEPELAEISDTNIKVQDIPTDVWSKPKSEVEGVSGSVGEWVTKKLLTFQAWFAQK